MLKLSLSILLFIKIIPFIVTANEPVIANEPVTLFMIHSFHDFFC